MSFWQQRDAPQIIRDLLRQHMDTPSAVRADVPDGWTSSSSPVVTVVSDGTGVTSRGYTTELVRVAVHARDVVTARRIMTAIDGFIHNPLKTGWHVNISVATGLMAIKDSHVGGGISSVTYRVTLNRGVFNYG